MKVLNTANQQTQSLQLWNLLNDPMSSHIFFAASFFRVDNVNRKQGIWVDIWAPLHSLSQFKGMDPEWWWLHFCWKEKRDKVPNKQANKQTDRSSKCQPGCPEGDWSYAERGLSRSDWTAAWWCLQRTTVSELLRVWVPTTIPFGKSLGEKGPGGLLRL